MLIGITVFHLHITEKDEAVQEVQRTGNWQFRTYTCTASFHFGKRSIAFISHLYQQDFMDKEKYSFLRPTGIETFAFIFSAGALQWLHGTTTDDDGREIGNFTLFGDLLARMALADGTSRGFHRPLMLSVGQAQYSEEQLSTHWNMGRKRIRRLLDGLERLKLIDTFRSRVASVMTFPCLLQWMTADGNVVSNPFIHKQRERIEPF